MYKTFLVIAAFLLLLFFAVQGAGGQLNVTKDEPLLAGQKNFLRRLVEDMDKSILYMGEDIENLESRLDSITLLEGAERDEDLSSLKESYKEHLKWLVTAKEAFEADYETLFTGAVNKGGSVKRCGQMVRYYEAFRGKAMKGLAYYEKKRERLVYYLNRQRFLMTETDVLRNEIASLEKRRERLPEEESRLNSLKSKLWAYQVEMNAIAPYREEMYLHYVHLIEQMREKGEWLTMKIEEYKALENLAQGLVSKEGDGVGSRYRELITLYEKEVSLLGKKVDLMGAKDWSITPYGDIREVERFGELMEYYKLMKSRYDDYKDFVQVQIDGFRADIEMNRRVP